VKIRRSNLEEITKALPSALLFVLMVIYFPGTASKRDKQRPMAKLNVADTFNVWPSQ
jgi:hypothetical protein